MDTVCVLWPVFLAGALGFLAGWLLNRRKPLPPVVPIHHSQPSEEFPYIYGLGAVVRARLGDCASPLKLVSTSPHRIRRLVFRHMSDRPGAIPDARITDTWPAQAQAILAGDWKTLRAIHHDLQVPGSASK